MRGLGTSVVMLVTFAAGIYVGGSLGVLGKPNDVYLQTDYDLGVIPYFRSGDKIHWLDPNLPPAANGGIASVPDIVITSRTNPCKDLDSNGICSLNFKTPATYTYKCKHCGDPTIPGGSNGPGTGGAWGGGDNGNQGANSAPAKPGSSMPGASVAAFVTLPSNGSTRTSAAASASGESSGFGHIYRQVARAFVEAFFTVPVAPGKAVDPDAFKLTATNPPLTQAFVQCVDNKITVAAPADWFPPTTSQIALGTKVKWVSQGGFPSTFSVMNLGNSTAFADACGAGPFKSNATGYTPACTLASTFSKPYVAYTIVDSTGKCTAPVDGFKIGVIPSPNTPPSASGVDLPGLR